MDCDASGEPGHELLNGLVTSRSRRECEVVSGERKWRCTVRGKVLREGGFPLVGDKVRFYETGPDQGCIEEILGRRTLLSRQVGRGRRARRHLYCANADTVVIVCAAQAPPIRPALVDRLLVMAGYEGLCPVICLNKVDLDPGGEAVKTMRLYSKLGYEVYVTSAVTGEGIEKLGRRLKSGITVFSGHSGVGKTSVLRCLVPGFAGKTSAVGKRSRGRHATSEVSLLKLPEGGCVADTPGFREFAVWGVLPGEIGSYYPEFLPYAEKCKYSNCIHLEEPGCGVRKAVEEGKIPRLRYSNYLKLLAASGE